MVLRHNLFHGRGKPALAFEQDRAATCVGFIDSAILFRERGGGVVNPSKNVRRYLQESDIVEQ